jgi:hypothetical protein
LSIKPIGDSSMNYLAERGNDMIGAMKKELNLDSDIKCTIVQFHGDSYNSQSDSWIGLKFYVESPDMFSYLGLQYQVNQSSERHYNTGQQRLYKFCYLLSFDLWTFYLARMLFLQGCGTLFGNLLVLQGSLMGCNIVSKCGNNS